MAANFQHEHWSSRAAFLLAAVGTAVGLGNVWRFPFIVGVNGGGAFVLVYIASIILIGIPLLMGELVLGRRGGQSAVESMRRLTVAEGRSNFWRAIGWFSIVTPFVGLIYYSVVAGWTLDYIFVTASGAFTGIDADGSSSAFGSLTGNPLRMGLGHIVFLFLTVFIVARGVQKGLEKAVKFLMPGLFALIVILVGYAAATADFAGALAFLLTPDFSKVDAAVVLMAVGQAFFSVSVAVGAMITYGAYMPEEISIPRSAAVIGATDTGVALLAGLAIFPLVLTYGLQPSEGPGLVFVTLPIAFGQMPAGIVFGTLFFMLMSIAALTSTIGMLEPVVSWLEEHRGFKRSAVAVATGVVVWLCGIAVVLSFNILRGFTPLDMFPFFEDKTIFDLIDFFTANILIPVGGLLIAIFVGWILKRDSAREELDLQGWMFGIWHFLVRFVSAGAILWIFIANFVTN